MMKLNALFCNILEPSTSEVVAEIAKLFLNDYSVILALSIEKINAYVVSGDAVWWGVRH
jgi:hypothetical protein